MTREELRKKRQEIAKNNGYSEYSSKKYSQQPMTTQETSESNIMPRVTTSQMPVTPSVSTWDKVQSKLASSSVSQERLKNTRNIPVTSTQPITQVETKKGSPNSKLNNLAYLGKKTVAGLLGGVTGLGQTAVTETASQLKKGEKESTGQAVTNLANKMLLPDSVNMIDATKETIKGNIDILKDKNKNAIQKIAGIGQNSVSGAVNTLPFKQKTNAVIQTIGSILKDKQTSNTALEVNKAISQPSQNFNQQLAEESERYGKPTQYAGEALQSVGNMIPSIATSMITGDPSARTINNGIKC